MKSKLTRAQRTMLRNAIDGRPLSHGLTGKNVAKGPANTLQALHRKGMLAGIHHLPTTAGLLAFTPQSTS